MTRRMAIFVVNPVSGRAEEPEGRCVPSDSQCGEYRCDCGHYSDAAVCHNGQTDVTCSTELYRGCYANENDCADNAANPDDRCCAGYGPGVSDNIDHQYLSDGRRWLGRHLCAWLVGHGLPTHTRRTLVPVAVRTARGQTRGPSPLAFDGTQTSFCADMDVGRYYYGPTA